MNSKWLVAFVALCLGVSALFFRRNRATVERSPYALFEPGMTTGKVMGTTTNRAPARLKIGRQSKSVPLKWYMTMVPLW